MPEHTCTVNAKDAENVVWQAVAKLLQEPERLAQAWADLNTSAPLTNEKSNGSSTAADNWSVNGSAIITAEQVQALDDLATALATAGSPELHGDIDAVLEDLPPLESFVGKTVDEARGIVIGHAIFLPLISIER